MTLLLQVGEPEIFNQAKRYFFLRTLFQALLTSHNYILFHLSFLMLEIWLV